MSDRDETLLGLATSVADGNRIDWSEVLRSGDPEVRRIAERLRILEQVARVHREQASAAVDADVDLDGLSTLQSPGASSHGTPVGEDERAWGELQLIEKVGRGTYGEVYRAWDPRLEREVALKLYSVPEAGAKPLSDLEKEGRLLARVRHPNVITVYGADRRDGRLGIWMEFVRGRNLEELLTERGPFSAREAALVGVDVCRALAAVHAAGMVHGDLKAQNIMREDGGRLVVMDFSAGREGSEWEDGGETLLSGTPLYMAPELLSRRPPTVASDVYAVGVFLYHLVTQTYPVLAKNLGELREVHLRAQRKLLRDARPDLPPGFIEVVERAIAAAPEERFASAGAFERALRGWLSRGDGEREEAAGRAAFSPSLWRAAAILLIAAGATYFLAMAFRTEPEEAALKRDGGPVALEEPSPAPPSSADVEPAEPSAREPDLRPSARPDPPAEADVESLRVRASLLQAFGHFAEARAVCERVLSLSAGSSGKPAIEHAHSMVTMASALQGMGEFAESESYYRQALAIYEKELGRKNSAYRANAQNLEALLRHQGKDPDPDLDVDHVSEPEPFGSEDNLSLTEVEPSSFALSRAYTIEAALYAAEGAEGKADRRLLPGSKVAPGDRLFLELRSSVPLHVYIVNHDDQGETYLLFPLPAYRVENPLPRNATALLPGAPDGEPMYWQVTSAGGREHILIVASPFPLEELEVEVEALAPSRMGEPVLAARLSPETIGRLRGIGGLVRGSSELGPAATSFYQIASDLPSRIEFVRGAWIRKVDLENPL